jgi:hypothetical protein
MATFLTHSRHSLTQLTWPTGTAAWDYRPRHVNPTLTAHQVLSPDYAAARADIVQRRGHFNMAPALFDISEVNCQNPMLT